MSTRAYAALGWLLEIVSAGAMATLIYLGWQFAVSWLTQTCRG